EVDEETKTITFSLSSMEKPLKFTRYEFITAIGLPICSNDVSLPPKETVRARLATLGLCDKDKPSLSSTLLVNSSPLKIKYFSPTLRIFMQYIEIDIGAIIFSDLVYKLQNGKKNMEKTLASEVALTSHMLQVAKLSQQLEQSLISFSKEVNADGSADKSLSRTPVQPFTQPKAPTDLKTKKKRIPPSSQPKSSYKVRVILPKKQVIETQHAEETVATADATQSLDASESIEEQVNQPKATEAKKTQGSPSPMKRVPKYKTKRQKKIKESRLESMEDITFDKIMDEIDQQNKDAEKGSQWSISEDLNVIDITPEDEGYASDPGLRGEQGSDEGKALVLLSLDERSSAEKVSEEKTSIQKVADDKPPLKKIKFLNPTSSIPSPTPLKSIMPESF
nr:hypothetical protein [Tanacetum cinerariifolium]